MPHAPEHQWQTFPDAAGYLHRMIDRLVQGNAFAERIYDRFLCETGTRFFDWVDHVTIHDDEHEHLAELGFTLSEGTWRHANGVFPAIRFGDQEAIAIKVDSVIDFAAANDLKGACEVNGDDGEQFMSATVSDNTDFMAVERHGYRGFHPAANGQQQKKAAREFYAAISQRTRKDERTVAERFATTALMISGAAKLISMDWACDIFFRAEREYWAARNRSAQIQKRRQDKLGVGWANHDHHTYRCSREHFAHLIGILELLGFHCRERFHAGEQAGWGAQVLEHPATGIVIFTDVDMLPEEVEGDFSHDGLSKRTDLGTVGLWCQLHGESFFQAGLHHLECQFDFDAARQQLATAGVETMAPFTDLPYLRQAFTVGEMWSVDPNRIDNLVAAGSIKSEQAAVFRTKGAIGSHLEILERNDGYKGFNQTGISHIITQTDPRN